MAFLDENGLEHLWQGLKGKFLALTGGTVNGNLRATGNISASNRVYTGSNESVSSGTPGEVLTGIGLIGLKSDGSAVIQFFPNGATSGARSITVSTSQFSFNDNISVAGNGAFSGSLSTYGATVPRILHGNLSVPTTADTAVEFSVMFPTSSDAGAVFPGIPDVVLTPRHNSDGLSAGLDIKLKTISTGGFSGAIRSSSGGTWVIHWIAMY